MFTGEKNMTHESQTKLRGVINTVESKVEEGVDKVSIKGAEEAKVDPQITYPCYKSFDEFIDVERLK